MDREFLIDLFASFGPVTIRPMFSGFGISADGINFALALRAGLFFRADEHTIPRFEAEGSKAFSYQTSTRSVTVASYWQLPARLFDDTDELSEWARAALAAAQRAALMKRAKARKLPAVKSGAKANSQSKAQPAKSRTTESAKKQAQAARLTKAKTTKSTKPKRSSAAGNVKAR
jgi:DNA transformation protein